MSHLCSLPSNSSWSQLLSSSKLCCLPWRQWMDLHPRTLIPTAGINLPFRLLFFVVLWWWNELSSSWLIWYIGEMPENSTLQWALQHLSPLIFLTLILCCLWYFLCTSTSCCLLLYIFKNIFKKNLCHFFACLNTLTTTHQIISSYATSFESFTGDDKS